jgi:hypothetical protein
MHDDLTETGQVSVQARDARAFGLKQRATSREIQRRGGGSGGLSVADGTPGTVSTSLSIAAGINVTTSGAGSVLEKLKHLRAHPAIELQSSAFFFSHAPLSWQQSLFAAIAASWVMAARAIPLATGSVATESAMSATNMALKIFMLALALSAGGRFGQVTGL